MKVIDDEKTNLARCVVAVAKKIIDEEGENVRLETGLIRVAQVGDLGFHFYTPFSCLPGNSQYVMGIWFDFIQVFEVRWEPFVTNLFQFGPWVNLLLHEGYSSAKDIAFLLHENEWLVPHASEIIEDILREHDENTV